MIELPEAVVIARQITETLSGKRIARVIAGASPHKFAWYSGDPADYDAHLAGKIIGAGCAVGQQIEFSAGDMALSIGAPLRYHQAGEKRPPKHQLLLEFEDGTAVSSTAQMWGSYYLFPAGGITGNLYADIGRSRPSPLTADFDRAYFASLFDETTPKLAAKAFLATEQRIPGLGNGVLQDILWTARIHPKRKMASLSATAIDALYEAIKHVLAAMTMQGGRDTERDLFGQPGGYRTILAKNTLDTPCPNCGAPICKEPFLGGAIYYCVECQVIS